MSSGKTKKTAAARATATPTPEDAPSWPEPFKPQPRLFVILLLVWVAWMVALLMLYFKVAYPNHL